MLRVAFSRDPTWAHLRRPSFASLLGIAVHSLYESAFSGELRGLDGPELRSALEMAWTRQMDRAWQDLSSAWGTNDLPAVERWPRYQLIRVKLLRSLERILVSQANLVQPELLAPPNPVQSRAEAWVQTPDGTLGGCVDRVEVREGDVELVDIKSGSTASESEGLLTSSDPYGRQLLLYSYAWWESTGAWPKRVSVQTVDGQRLSADVDRPQAELLAAEARGLLEQFNRLVGSELGPTVPAAPSREHCQYCPFRAPCPEFWAAVQEDWDLYRPSVLGTVTANKSTPAGRLVTITVQAGSLSQETREIAVISAGRQLECEEGASLAIVDALPTGSPRDVRLSWDSVVLTVSTPTTS